MAKTISAESARNTKSRIILETLALIQKEPAHSITINEICRACDITKSTFYYHFRSIDDVIDSVSDVLEEELTSSLSEILSEETCIEQILHIFMVIHRRITEMGCAIAARRYILRLKRMQSSDFPRSEPGWSLLVALFTKAISLGELYTSLSAEELTESCFFIIRGVCYTWCMESGSFDLAATARVQLNRFLSGFQR